MSNNNLKATLNTVASILIRCFISGAVILTLWLGIYLLLGEWTADLHSKIFNIDKSHITNVMYYGMAFYKMLVIVFFLLPYIAIKLVVRKM